MLMKSVMVNIPAVGKQFGQFGHCSATAEIVYIFVAMAA